MQVHKAHFGTYKDQMIEQYILSNDNGMSVKIMNYQ